MGEKGVAVIMAMWLLAVLAIIGTTFVFMMRLEPIIARTHRDDMKAMYITQAGIDHAVYWLRRDTDLTIDSLKEDWATYFTVDPDPPDGEPAWHDDYQGPYQDILGADGIADPRWITLTDEDGNVFGYYAVIINDEAGKVSLNNPLADNSPWKNLLDGLPNLGTTKVNNIFNYQKGTYGPFETLDELACVYDISEESLSVYHQVAKVHHKEFPTNPDTRLPINVNTANEKALKAAFGRNQSGTPGYAILKVTETNIDQVVAAILAYRAGADGIERTTDDNPFDGVDSYVGDQQGKPTTIPGDGISKDNFGTISTDLDPAGGSFPGATVEERTREEFNTLINYIRAFGYPSGSDKITKAYVRDNIKDNFDVGVDYDNYDSNTDVDGNQDNHYRCPDCHIVVKNPTEDTPTTCPKCGRVFTVGDPPERIYTEIDRDGTYEPGLCPNHNGCPMGGKVMSIDSNVCPICGVSVTPTAYDPLDFSADPETYTTNFSFNNSPTGPPQSYNNQFFEIISTGKYVSPSGQETLKRIRIIINRGKATPAIEGKILYYKEIPED